MLWGKVQVDLGRCQGVVPEQPLQGRQGDPALDDGHGIGMAQHMRGHRAADTSTIGNAFDDPLNGAVGEPRVSLMAKCPSTSGRMRLVIGITRRLVFDP